MNMTLLFITTPINPWILDKVETCGGTPHASTTPTTKSVIIDVVRSSARIIRNPCGHVSRTGRDCATPQDGHVSGPGKGPVLIGVTISPTITSIQDNINPHGSTGSVEVRDTQIFNSSVDGNLAKNVDYTPIFSKAIERELSHGSSANIYLRYIVDVTSNAVGTKAPNYMHLGLPDVNASDELKSFGTPTTIFGSPTDGSNLSAPGHIFGEVTAVGMSRTRS